MITQQDIDGSVVYALRLAGEEMGYSPVRAGKTVSEYKTACDSLLQATNVCLSYLQQYDFDVDVNRTAPGQIRVRLASTTPLHPAGGDYEWYQITTVGPDLNKWVRARANDYIDVDYTLYYTYVTSAQRQAIEETINAAFGHYGYLRIYTGLDAGTPQKMHDVSTQREGFVYLPAFDKVGTGMCQLTVKGAQVTRTRYWNQEGKRWVLNVADATKYLNSTGIPAPPVVDVDSVAG